MNHLNEHELEEVLAGRIDEPAHLGECQACRQRLAEHRAIGGRLRSA